MLACYSKISKSVPFLSTFLSQIMRLSVSYELQFCLLYSFVSKSLKVSARFNMRKYRFNIRCSLPSFICLISLNSFSRTLNTLKSRLNTFETLYQLIPEELTADAGYGSEENYDFFEEKEIETFVKYTIFDKEQGILKSKSKKLNENFHRDTFYYDPETDQYTPVRWADR